MSKSNSYSHTELKVAQVSFYLSYLNVLFCLDAQWPKNAVHDFTGWIIAAKFCLYFGLHLNMCWK